MWAAPRTTRLFAMITGVVRFEDQGALGKFISVLPAEEAAVGGADRAEVRCRTCGSQLNAAIF